YNKIFKNNYKNSEDEALQQLYQLCPNLNSQSKKLALTIIFLKPNCDEPSIRQIIKGQNYTPYFKNAKAVTLLLVKNILPKMLYNNVDLTDATLTEDKEFL
ncbi:8857_t:CDS:2, partial [Racocetra fulgida]